MPASARTYAEKRDFSRTPEPAGGGKSKRGGPKGTLRFVVQRHDASRLHFDFRLEHEGVLLSWAVPKGPSLDPSDKRLAVRTEDHPLDYADFEGEIPAGNYGAGTVEIWDRGTWTPRVDPVDGLASGDLKFSLDGARYRGNFVLVRMKPKARDRGENWLLIKERDDEAPARAKRPAARAATGGDWRPQLATLVQTAPSGPEWITEIKLDGYRLIAEKDGEAVRLLTRNGLDWTHRLPTLAAAVAHLAPAHAVLDGELVAFAADGTTSFSKLQEALSAERDAELAFMAFDLLALEGDDLRGRPLSERKQALTPLIARPRRLGPGAIRLSEHLDVDAGKISREACRMGLEGVICKRLDSPYRAGRGRDWVKVKCDKRDEMVILGWTAPRGSRKGLGAIHLGLHGEGGRLTYVGGCGTGFSDETLASLSARLQALASDRPKDLVTPEKPPPRLAWVRPELVAEIGHAGFTDGGMVRHARFLGLREDKPPGEVTRADTMPAPTPPSTGAARPARSGAPRLTHPDRELWPGISKRDLAEYWAAIADHALPGIADRPLALLRCPEGITGETFFQKHAMRGNPPGIREGKADDAPYLAISDASGLADLAQLSAIELHAWGASLAAPLQPDRLVFDLDPDPKVSFAEVIAAARDIRRALEAIGLPVFVRTTGGKGLHLVVPVVPRAGWDETRAWTRAFAMALERAEPKRFIASSTRKNVRSGKILIDWLRNGLGSTAIASFSPRARKGATVATPIARSELNSKLDPTAFTLRTVPARLSKQRRDPWSEFEASSVDKLPDLNWEN